MKRVILHHLTNHLLKCSAVILTVLCWLHINYNKPLQCSVNVPLLFDSLSEEITIEAPETIALLLQGTRAALYTLDTTASAVHIDAKNLTAGKHTIVASRETFFLPEALTVLHYSSCDITVHLV